MGSDYVNYNSDEGNSLTAYAQWSSTYHVKGDANMDGVTNTDDITTIINYINGVLTLTNLQLFLADYNSDGIVNINDVTAIQKNL